MTSDQLTACKGCIQIPWSLGAVVPAYNLNGAPNNINLTGPVLADMFLGKVTAWNDPEIAKLNPGRQPAVDEDHPGVPHRRLG